MDKNNIKQLRIKKGFTQLELAEKSNISRVSIGNYERNERVPDLFISKRIANALEVKIEDLIL